jgi:GH18 family chitinase
MNREYDNFDADGLSGAFEWTLSDDDANATIVKTMAEGLGIGSN